MADLAIKTKQLDFQLEQVQDFTPTPMTVATEAWFTGYHPYTLEPVFSAKTAAEKQAQRLFFFWYKDEERRGIISELTRLGRPDLIKRLFGNEQSQRKQEGQKPKRSWDQTQASHRSSSRPSHKGRRP